jgi:hypothetical protein
MFRIHFTRKGTFVIQVLRFGLFWITVKHETFEYFPSLTEARRWAHSVGLEQLYQEQVAPIHSELPEVFFGRGAK